MAEEKSGGKEAAVQKGKQSPVLVIIIIVLVLLALVGGGVAGYFLLMAPKSGQSQVAAAQVVDVQAQGQTYVPGGLSGPMKAMDTFIVNLTDAQGTRYLKVTIQLEMSHEMLSQEIEKRLPQIRDEVITLLSSKSFDDVATIAGKRALKRSIISSMNKYLTTGKVLNVYFSEFVVQ
ncbi:MAG: flagellar basal body protein FliL [Bacteriovoracaceae bacterium]|jgi:flagellar FliL protein|nr:flagellar basal body protein FliL [Bacteriovoracaceae bacterium]HPX49746.1 flagellar basal body-associated FliL family protein [Deltaproteobacteria bacterium]HRR20779.1 flagellar basal body-associated FliL family protein [Desulfomonilia bacterium]HQA71077.1 flagellar basal body-associated FliL family protein [Deltaproteobacteria bacterium]HRR68410.1 flagellar basal body-associated FliL family protein [Desulfomonilia bacterium]